MLAPSTDARVAALDAQAKGLRQRIATVEADYDAGLIDGQRFKIANEKIGAELHKAEAERIAMLAGSAVGGILGAPDPVAAYDSAGLGAQRAVVDALLDVQVHRAPRGRAVFDPETIQISWR